MPSRQVAQTGVRSHYDQLVSCGAISADPAQVALADRLDRLNASIAADRLAAKSSALGWMFGRKRPAAAPRGLYIHGAVGRGKTMLMDFFFAACPEAKKRRAHFHEFMTDAHERIHAHRQALKRGETGQDDPIPPVAAALADEARVICFDEFSVTDIADAMILSRLFTALFARRVVLVATSNVAPVYLYRDGLTRGLFLPFLKVLREHTDVANLDADKDYRLDKLGRAPVWHAPLTLAADRAMDDLFATMTGGVKAEPAEIAVKGRAVCVPRQAMGIARFDFSDLCDKPLGAADYRAIAQRYKTVFIDRVPVLDEAKRNPAKRFIALIDTLYDNGNRVAISAEAEPEKLYVGKSGSEAFEFARTASRLVEMRSAQWLSGEAG